MNESGTPTQHQAPQRKQHNLFSRILHRLLAYWWALIAAVAVTIFIDILLIPSSQGLNGFWPHVRGQLNALLMLQVTQTLLFDVSMTLVIILTVAGFLAHERDKRQQHQLGSPGPTNTTTFTFQKPVVEFREGHKTEYHEPVVRIGSITLSDTSLDLFSNNQERKASSGRAFPQIWNVPYQQNQCFTGREEVLHRLHAELTTNNIAAISGSDGIGKTQTAVEYAYRFQGEYQAVLWVQAETQDLLINDCAKAADLLHLLERERPQAASLVSAVKQWLETYQGWLMILDNVRDVALLQEVLPIQRQGHVLLLTTRAQVIRPLVQPQVLVPLTPTEGMRFLLKQTRSSTSSTSRSADWTTWQRAAQELSEVLGGLPLALEQAGAYMKETGCSIRRYQRLYRQFPRTQRTTPEYRRGRFVTRHIEAVAITWALTFEHVKENNPELAELLHYCTFLYPEAIPVDLFSTGAPVLSPRLQQVVNTPQRWDAAIDVLSRFSLLKYQPQTEMLCLHHMVQAYLKGNMRPQTQRSGIEKTVRFVNLALPQVEIATGESFQRYLPHAIMCSRIIVEENLTTDEAGQLLAKVGSYYFQCDQDDLASPLLERARDILEQKRGKEHPTLAPILNILATIRQNRGKLEEALPLFEQMMTVQKMQPGPADHAIASTLNKMAAIYQEQGEPEKALPLLQQALEIEEQQLEKTDPARVSTLSNLAAIYQEQGEPEKALPLLQQALEIEEQQPEGQDGNRIHLLKNLADTFHVLGRDDQALPFLRQILQIQERQLGPEHPDLVHHFLKLAECCEALSRYEEALPLLHRALGIQEHLLGKENPDLVPLLCKLTDLYRKRGLLEEALPFLERALAIKKQQLGPDHLDLVDLFINLAVFYQMLEKYQEASDCLEQALHIQEQNLGPEHPEVATRLTDLAVLYYRFQGRPEEALPILKRALAIREKSFGPEHIDVAPSWEALACFYRARADAMDTRARGIRAKHSPNGTQDSPNPIS